MLNRVRRPGLRGRHAERAALDQLVQHVRAGQSRVLVLRGEPGVGKTTLLDDLVERAYGCHVARAAGVESEIELAFAGLHQLCAPLLDRVDHLPGPQRDALMMAFGLSAGAPPEGFVLGLALLGLLSDAAAEQPLLIVVDDVQWLDRASAQTVAFMARRLRAESVGVVFAMREPAAGKELTGLPELVLRGLPYSDARALLESAIHGPLDARVRDRIVAETRGNPLALLELPRGCTPAELAGGFGLPDKTPLATCIEARFRRRVERLPRATQRLLITAAAEPIGDGALLWRAAERLGIGAEAAVPAEAAELIHLGARVRFRHPLVRSAAYRGAAVSDLRDVHRALAEASDPEIDPDHRAWHRAHAAAAPDESVAGEVERSAARVQHRGGVAAAAAFLERATELTPDPARRGARAVAAAEAMLEAAAIDRAFELVATAELSPLDELRRARLEWVRARLTYAARGGRDAPQRLLDAAKRLEPLDVTLAREAYLDALGAAIFSGRLSHGPEVRAAAEAARAAPAGPQPPRAIDMLLDGLALRFTEGYAPAVPLLRRAVYALARERERDEEALRFLGLACSVSHELWDDAAWDHVSARAVEIARDTGALTSLPRALTYRAGVHIFAAEFAAASTLIDEAGAVSDATDTPTLPHAAMVLAAWGGREAPTLELIDASIKDAAARGEERVTSVADYARAVLYNGHGRYEAALAAAQRASQYDDLGVLNWVLIELVEASVRLGRLDLAAHGVQRLEGRTRAAAGSDWALGIQAALRALLSGGQDPDGLYREAIERLARTRVALHRARTQLLYGEWLRREGRRVDAREQLRAAHDTFRRIGAEGFARRAHRELVATTPPLGKRDPETRDELTLQEAQIARLARDGLTNPEIAGELYLSPRTVEWHLRKVFAKLGVGSRRQLRDALSDGQPPARVA